MPTVRLSHRAALSVSGKDARSFLQGLVTNDIDRPNADGALYAALLTAQGKIVADFILKAEGEGWLVDVEAAQAAELLKRLKLYRLRAAVTLDDLSDRLAVVASWGEDAAGYADPRAPALGRRAFVAIDQAPAADDDAYRAHRLALGVPEGAEVEGRFALDANFEELRGVDFKKGCFVGQEVTARMKHKAAPRKRMAAVAAAVGGGARLTDGGGLEIGEIAGSAGGLHMTALRLDRIGGATGLSVEGVPAQILTPGYSLPPLEAALSEKA